MPSTQASSALSRGAKYLFWTIMVPAMLTLAFVALLTLVFGQNVNHSDITSWLIVIITVLGVMGIGFFGAWLSDKKTRSFANDLAARYLARVCLALTAANIVLYLWIVAVLE